MKFDETSSTEQQLHVFDFLDKEMDDDDVINNFFHFYKTEL